jgi:hypothetical protein
MSALAAAVRRAISPPHFARKKRQTQASKTKRGRH